ncbi:MAG: sodium:calcium antiporter [Candidatus Aenigmarchaeota archaeon]|nr:sodium:calcium antiporter [Candidatus Aenigmarchaeota archaeon]
MLAPLLVALGIVLIYLSSERVIRYAVNLARLLGLSTLVVGFLLVSVSTSLPETFVAVFAALDGDPQLAVGNVLGSILFDINIILGLSAVMAGAIVLKRKENLHLIELLFISTVIAVLVFSVPRLTVTHGVALLLLFLYSLRKLYKSGKPEARQEEDLLHHHKRRILGMLPRERSPYLTLAKFLGSVAVLLLGAKLLTDGALLLAGDLGLGTVFVGATLVTFGTSLPELTVALAALRKKYYGLALGDLVGAGVTNLTLVLGLLALLAPGPVNLPPITGILPFLLASTLFLWYTLAEKGRVTSTEGAVLLLIYLGFLLEQLGLLGLFGG